MSEGLYVSEKHRTRRRQRIAGIAAGIAVFLGAASYATATLLNARDDIGGGDVGALAPVISEEPSTEPAPTTTAMTMPTAPPPGLGPGTRSAQRRSSTPSPAPSPPPMTDDEIAAAQVSRLIQPRPQRSGGVGIAGVDDRVTVRNETTPDGARVRVVSARSELTGIWAGDAGRPVNGVRCTRSIKTDKQPAAQTRPGMLLCWRSTAGKSVVAVATGQPQEIYTAALVAREWTTLG